MMMQEWMSILIGPFQELLSSILVKLPSILAAFVLLLIGMVIARFARIGVEKFFKVTKLDDYTEQLKINELTGRLGLGDSPGFVVGFLVYWLIILVFLVSAANVVELTVVSQLMQGFVLFIPKLIGAVLVAAGGLLLGHFFAEIVLNAAMANKLDGAVALSKAVRFTVVAFAGIMALEQIGIGTEIITSSLQIIIGAVGLGLALAFGLGGRDAAGDVIRNFVARQRKT
jgi:hypothetical protein